MTKTPEEEYMDQFDPEFRSYMAGSYKPKKLQMGYDPLEKYRQEAIDPEMLEALMVVKQQIVELLDQASEASGIEKEKMLDIMNIRIW
ncbi:hypothetical protein AD945_04285 [Gluconobacter albidus]|uniref:Uncharacterized protein n=1 Tax=Gluconobacter albidus TaxID=318683 RepID=A0A149TL89_9PROT|nr:hypothetical protein [Gluconobacter albidus]KXV49426.1 hypothetical protein AD945_04285 [Gluconobacter albidus]